MYSLEAKYQRNYITDVRLMYLEYPDQKVKISIICMFKLHILKQTSKFKTLNNVFSEPTWKNYALKWIYKDIFGDQNQAVI